MKTIVLPLHALRGLLFGEAGDETIPIRKPVSGGIGDIAKIKVVHYEIGEAIKLVDTEEEQFHVELFDDTQTKNFEAPDKRAEVWLKEEWKISNARRERFKTQHSIENKERNRKQELASKIVQALEGKLQPTFAQLFAHQVVDQYKRNDISGILKKLKIWELIEEYEKENQ